MRNKSQALTIDELRARFEAWRQNRQGKSPTPDELWSAAAELARKDDIALLALITSRTCQNPSRSSV